MALSACGKSPTAPKADPCHDAEQAFVATYGPPSQVSHDGRNSTIYWYDGYPVIFDALPDGSCVVGG